MALATSLSLLLGIAAAANTPPTVPQNAQIGEFNLPLSCTAGGAAYTLDALITATAPFVVAPGQPVYFTDTVATITVPGALTGKYSTAKKANTQAFAKLAVSNGSPASVDVLPGGKWINGTSVTPGQPVTVRIPSGTAVLPNIGPVTAGSSGTTTVYLGDLSANVYLFNSAGGSVSGSPVKIVCTAPSSKTVVALLNINGARNTTALAPANGFQYNFPAVTSKHELGYYHTTYNCTVGIFKNIPTDLIFGGQAAAAYTSGSSFSIVGITSFLTVPQNFIDAAHSVYKADKFTTTVNSVSIGITNASPASVNPISSPITQTYTYTAGGSGLKIYVPVTGSLSAGPFTAGSTKGAYMTLSLGGATASLSTTDSSGGNPHSFDVTCIAPSNYNLYSILIK